MKCPGCRERLTGAMVYLGTRDVRIAEVVCIRSHRSVVAIKTGPCTVDDVKDAFAKADESNVVNITTMKTTQEKAALTLPGPKLGRKVHTEES